MTKRRLKMMEVEGIPFDPVTKPLELELESEEEYRREVEKRGGRDPVE